MRVIQFAFNQGIPSGVPILDCRDYMSRIYSKSATREHPRFEEAVRDGVRLVEEYDVVAVGCQQGKHRSVAIAAEIGARLGVEVEYGTKV